MKIASNIVGIVAPVSALGAAPPATSGFGALLAMGGDAPVPATGQPLVPAPVPASAATTLIADIAPPTVSLPAAEELPTEAALPVVSPEAAEAPVAPSEPGLPDLTEQPAKSEPVALAKPADPQAALPAAAPQLPAAIVAAVAAPVVPAVIDKAKAEIETKTETDDTPAPDKAVAPVAQPAAAIVAVAAPVKPAEPIAVAADAPEIAAGAVKARPRQAAAAAETVSGSAKVPVETATQNNPPTQNALPATRAHGFSEVYETHRAAHAAAEPVIAAQPGRIGREMGVEIARYVVAGRDEMTVRLDPPEMGRVDIRLSFDRDGAVRGVIAADSPSALDLLRKETGDLTRALADAGIRSDGQSFRFDSRARDFGQQQHQQQRHAESGRENAPQSGGPALKQPVYRALRASGRIDLMA